ncbi:hypothetical protein [Nocardia pseudobrasiliensis]|uniref:O-antigen polysaccharide polymerase Wzy-like protein n=1 Tax=Nocardia pseudobrasiliensis TaxID=45979 RepID=A0A370IAK3_9NOCA|nr:hypothetical protein [Nocardia pseudobrasiliensis]RDI67743.1 hypothetical protein DFR76_102142 [Nocardia pseudobrasiliensis]
MTGVALPQVALVAGALASIVLAGLWLPGPVRVFLVAQSAHWSLSYVARPVVLLWVQPEPHYGDNLPDPRLAALGYDAGIATVLGPVVFGLWFYAGLVVAYAIWTRSRQGREPASHPFVHFAHDPVFTRTLAVLYALGTLGRLAAVATGNNGRAGELESPNPIVNLITILATIGAVGLIVYVRTDRVRDTLLIIGALTAGELLWTAAVQSKTPIMGAALAIAVRCAMTGWTRANLTAVLAITAVAVGGFGWLQSLKATDTAKAEAAVTDSSYPPLVHPFLSLLRRFDGLEAATDAYYAGPHSWLSPEQVLVHAVQSLIPSQLLGAEKFRSGAEWAMQVRGQSVDMGQVSVSLAEGNINEGYVLGGYFGVALGVSITFALLLVWERSLYSRFVALPVFGLALIEVPVLFERGMLGTIETLGKYLQAMVLVWITYLFVAQYRRQASTGESRTAQWV